MSQNIKNNLFRFVTLRNPQLIDEKDKQTGFVYHPDGLSGSFFTPLNAAIEEEKKQALLDAKDSFINSQSLFKKKSDVKAFNANLYQFSFWLMRNKNTLSYAEVIDNINDAQVLDANDLLKIWDNLIYQTLSRHSVYIREALIQMLIANQFLDAFNDLSENTIFTEEQSKEFARRAKASVVIPKSLLLETYTDKPVNTKAKQVNIKHQKRLCDLLTAKYDRLALRGLTNELKALKAAYDTQEKENYKKELKKHQDAVDETLDSGTVKLVDVWDIEKQAYIQVENFVHGPLPEFNYQKTVEIDATQLKEALSGLSHKYLMENGLDKLTSYDAILKEVKRLSRQKSNNAVQLLPKADKSVLKSGASMRLEDPFKQTLANFGDADARITQMMEDNISSSEIPLMVASEIDSRQVDSTSCYTVNVVAYASGSIDGERSWNFKIGINYNEEFSEVTAVDQSLSFTNDSNSITSTSFESGNTTANHSKIRLFNDLVSISKPASAGNPVLSGTITLANGDTLNFSETIIMQPFRKGLLGSQLIDFKCEDGILEETPSTFGKIYGVTNLGIADFRRVEQEVCCYVPGEVSHIENVMAREYKERSTRSLTSSEFTTERTDERERENLTDTTSTERNEMQSEVASVLNEDQSQSYGGNANVAGGSGDLFRFQVGSHFDTASASSSSNSNSQAQTYAQEITERAMERIVQKTQTKRTSRILKEFEENTSHGFDNRKGENHVTGVYRWVDKIYKNTLINYGKRLMYEFAIPEPSKFFQEAVWKQVDETGQVESGVILPEMPVHPKEIGVVSASDLDQDNYQDVSSKYNAEVNTIPNLTMEVSKAFKVEFGGDSEQEGNSSADKIEVPEGYIANHYKARGVVYAHAGGNNPDHAKMTLSVGDKQLSEKLYSGPLNGEDDLPSISNEVAVSASTYDTLSASYNITISCNRTPELLEQWQNETYNAIMEAYYDRMQEYNDAIREQEANESFTPEKEKLTFNPLQNKSIMLRELKRVAIELLIDKTRVSKDNFEDMDEDTGVSEVKRSEAFQTHASTVKFFEQAFDWDIMAYVFYPYFYAKEQDWKKLFQLQEAADPLFQAFLQSGMARTVVPVRPGFEDAVNWYMTTGETWNGQGLVVDQDDDLYVSVAEEMETIEGEVEGTWETRLPTALTMLQAGSIGLDVQGLPCNEECALELFESDKSPIKQTDTLIGGEDGVGSDVVSEPITVQ